MSRQKPLVRILKMVNGESLICRIVKEKDEEGLVLIEYPLEIVLEEEITEEDEVDEYTHRQMSANISLYPWIPYSNQTRVNVPLTQIVAVVTPSAMIYAMYSHSVRSIQTMEEDEAREVQEVKMMESTIDTMEDILKNRVNDNEEGEIQQWLESLELNGIILNSNSN